MPKDFTYAKAGVDRERRSRSKAGLELLKQTHILSKYGAVISLPYGNIFPLGDRYLDLQIEGVGTKVLLAQLADKYDTIGVDGVAMVVNDVIRSGARPLALADNIHTQASDPRLVEEWVEGIVRGSEEAGCIVSGGEIGDVSDVVKGVKRGRGFDMVVACVGELSESDIVWGNSLKPGDAIVGLRSSGIHSNGVSLARRVLFKRWGGKYGAFDVPDCLDTEIIYEVLKPTRIYVKPILSVAREYKIKGAVHITGDAYLKFDRLMRFSRGVGFEFDSFKPQPIFRLIQESAPEVRGPIPDDEMLKTFNMGWGFAVITEEPHADDVIDLFNRGGIESERIGEVTDSGRILAKYMGRAIVLK